MAEADFATTVLTSKLPQEVAAFIPHLLQLTLTLVERNLVVWFTNYANMLMRFNQDLNILVANGRNFFTRLDAEFGSLDKMWNCVASCVTLQIAVNDAIVKLVKSDIVAPLGGIFHSDFKYGELMVNAQELGDVAAQMESGDADGNYNWNVKAPTVLANFENYKKYEKGVLSLGFLAYLNTVNAKTLALLQKNEGAVNYILKEFDLDREMESYTQYVVGAKVDPPAPVRPRAEKRASRIPSALLIRSKPKPEAPKKKGLRLRMNSILGRKKKIPENATIDSYSDTSRRNSVMTDFSERPTRPTHLRGNLTQSHPLEVAAPQTTERAAHPETPKAAEHAPQVVEKEPAPQPAPGVSKPQTLNTAPLSPTVAEPNVVKYDSSDDSDVPRDADGHRMLMLNAHLGKDAPSFEYGDESRVLKGRSNQENADQLDSQHQPPQGNPLQTQPQFQSQFQNQVPNNVGAHYEARIPPAVDRTSKSEAAAVGAAVGAVAGAVGIGSGLHHNNAQGPSMGSFEARAPGGAPGQFDHQASAGQDQSDSDVFADQSRSPSHEPEKAKPLPPPSRKVAPKRDSTYSAPLVSQTTGNSLISSHFHHFEGALGTGLNTSIAEIVSATFKGGEVTKAQAFGEVAFNYNGSSTSPMDVHVPTTLLKSLLNEQVMTGGPHTYKVDLRAISGRTLGGLKYMVDLAQSQVPFTVQHMWKFEPHQASLIVKINPNPRVRLVVDTLTVLAAIDGVSLGASSKPEGTFNKEKNRITWRFTNATINEDKLIARIMTNGLGKEAASGVQVKYTVSEATPVVKVEGGDIVVGSTTGSLVSYL